MRLLVTRFIMQFPASNLVTRSLAGTFKHPVYFYGKHFPLDFLPIQAIQQCIGENNSCRECISCTVVCNNMNELYTLNRTRGTLEGYVFK
jgi:hypothetical protein